MDYIKRLHLPPKTLVERENLYGRIRKLALWLDNIPGIPAPIGLEAIVGFIPVFGDFIGVLASLYQVYLTFLFGIPTYLLLRLLVNVVIDFVIGLLPWVGDMLDILYKSNIYNLNLLEQWLTENHLVDVQRYKMEHPLGQGAGSGASSRRGGPSTYGSQSRGYY
ncbi:hypothetical protein BGW42_002420 [Actinomortierella wolfii]|nr:hypothetical protein BGW42_002420 [Actinomortierella wolfii]KAG0229913.1 hypothetical protein BGW41_002843 [Actinomortierella wolfii]